MEVHCICIILILRNVRQVKTWPQHRRKSLCSIELITKVEGNKKWRCTGRRGADKIRPFRSVVSTGPAGCVCLQPSYCQCPLLPLPPACRTAWRKANHAWWELCSGNDGNGHHWLTGWESWQARAVWKMIAKLKRESIKAFRSENQNIYLI